MSSSKCTTIQTTMETIRLCYGRDSDEMVRRLVDATKQQEQRQGDDNDDYGTDGGNDDSDDVDRIVTLEVRETVLDEAVIAAIADFLIQRNVETVHLDDCGARLNGQAVRMARALGQVKNVRLSEPTFLSQFFLDSMLLSSSTLETLRLQDNLDCRQLQALSSGLVATTCLRSLDLSRSRIDSFDILAKGLKGNSSLQQLKLRSLGIGDHHMVCIVTAIGTHPSLTSIDMSFNHCRQTSELAKFLFNKSRTTVVGVPPINELDMGYQNVWQAPKMNLSSLFDALEGNIPLRCLSLPRSKLDDDDARLLSKAISSNVHLEVLDIRENKIYDAGMESIGTALSKCTSSLQRINVMTNPFGKVGADALLDASKKNYRIIKIDININDNHVLLTDQIRYYTALNRGGRKLLCEKNLPLSLWPHALERVNSIDWEEHIFAEHGTKTKTKARTRTRRGTTAMTMSSEKTMNLTSSPQFDVIYFMLQGPVLFEGTLCRPVVTVVE